MNIPKLKIRFNQIFNFKYDKIIIRICGKSKDNILYRNLRYYNRILSKSNFEAIFLSRI